MATKRQRGKTWHYTVRRAALLPKPVNLTFDTEEEGDQYVQLLESLLDHGIVPEKFIKRQTTPETISQIIALYQRSNSVPHTDQRLLSVIANRVGAERVSCMFCSDVGRPPTHKGK